MTPRLCAEDILPTNEAQRGFLPKDGFRWTLQERLLSERILYFGHFGTWWDWRGATYEELNHRESGQEDAKLLFTTWVFSGRLLKYNFPGTTEIWTCLDAEEDATETLDVTKNYMVVVMSAYLDDDGDEGEWRASPTEVPHEVYGLVVESTGTRYSGIEEYRRIGTFDVQDGMGSGIIQDSVCVMKPFYEQMYASRHIIALILKKEKNNKVSVSNSALLYVRSTWD